MSFILDALRKSESERQRQLGPALLNLPVGTARRGMPMWGWLVAALLGINLLILIWLGLRSPATAPKHATAPAQALRAPPVQAPNVPAAPINAFVPESAAQPQPLPAAPPGITPRSPQAASHAAENSDNPADIAPAVEPPAGAVNRQSIASYAAVSDHVPALRLDLHVYSADRADRYALINMHKVREGDTLPEGPRVQQITRDAVILNYQGEDFSLGRE
ncbi:MAG TPA: general secretion pathway protein GspB [Steroidobacteraceae bacterium]